MSGQPIAPILQCELCRRVRVPADKDHWRAYSTDDGGELVFFCPVGRGARVRRRMAPPDRSFRLSPIVLARIATFDAGRELSDERSDWVMEALSGTPGLRCAYHLRGRDGTLLSVSVWDSIEAGRRGSARIREARERRGLESDPPDKEEFFDVVNEYRIP
jgi:hypothetical protein